MANQQDLNVTYSTIDKVFRLSMGEMADFSCAKYDGDFSMSLEEAQRAKHKFIAENLNIKKGSRVIDLGCGWGPFLRYIKDEIGAEGIGLTLSDEQAKACRKNGLEVYVKDCRNVKPADFGKFDAVVSMGAMEHFCSLEEYKAGKQEEIYRSFYKSVFGLLKDNGKAFIQTMVFSKNMIPYEQFDIDAPVRTAPRMLAIMTKEFPGSWLPYGKEMVLHTAEPYFRPQYISSGRLDYIETINQWRQRFRKFNLKKYMIYLKHVPQYVFNKDFRRRAESLITTPNQTCFELEIMDHYRVVFQKAGPQL